MLKRMESHQSKSLDCDVLIVGAGPAGISLALELAALRSDWSVVLAEGGDIAYPDHQSNLLYEVSTGPKSYLVQNSRLRMLGGTSMHWGGWCRPFDLCDFHLPPSWGMADWPITHEEIYRFLPDASRWCEIDAIDYETSKIHADHRAKLIEWKAGSFFENRLFRFSPPTRFGARYIGQLESSKNVFCFLDANLVALKESKGKVVSATFLDRTGTTRNVTAKNYVIAMGGIENTRVLLNMREGKRDDGEGTRSPLLGRYFVDHYGLRLGQVLGPERMEYFRFLDPSGPCMPVIARSQESLVSRKFPNNHCMMLNPSPGNIGFSNMYPGQPSLGWKSGSYWLYDAMMIVEPKPCYTSQISLLGETCKLGWKRARLDWSVDESDAASATEFLIDLGASLGAAGIGRVRIDRNDWRSLLMSVSGSYHHMGTTRMSRDPKDGVVDKNCRVFDLDNLYVSSSSTFPRAGFSNPTLTIVALSVRLAHELARQ